LAMDAFEQKPGSNIVRGLNITGGLNWTTV
jgi:hypothetical protein